MFSWVGLFHVSLFPLKHFRCKIAFDQRNNIGSLNVQNVVEIGDVANGKPKNFNFGKLLVWWKGRQQLPQFGEGHIEGFDTDALACSMGRSVLCCRTPPPSLLFPAQRLWSEGSRLPLSIHRFIGDAADFDVVEDRFSVWLAPREVGTRLIWTQHHFELFFFVIC